MEQEKIENDYDIWPAQQRERVFYKLDHLCDYVRTFTIVNCVVQHIPAQGNTPERFLLIHEVYE